jgi:hypothetical protein
MRVKLEIIFKVCGTIKAKTIDIPNRDLLKSFGVGNLFIRSESFYD